MTRKRMAETLKNDPKLVSRLVPDFAMGCRRLGPAEGFLEAMASNKVELGEGAISHFTPKGLMTDNGTEYEADVIICATGFDVSFRPYFPVIGRGGKQLADHWSEDPEAYFALAAAGFPNFMRRCLFLDGDVSADL
jgi:cation diffusion facilitator CzcD-associated flavoprotein CzcO